MMIDRISRVINLNILHKRENIKYKRRRRKNHVRKQKKQILSLFSLKSTPKSKFGDFKLKYLRQNSNLVSGHLTKNTYRPRSILQKKLLIFTQEVKSIKERSKSAIKIPKKRSHKRKSGFIFNRKSCQEQIKSINLEKGNRSNSL